MHLQKGFLPVQIAVVVVMGVASLAVGYKAVTNSTEIRSKAASLYPDQAAQCIQTCNTITVNSKKAACITDCAKKFNFIKVTPTPTKGLIKITPTPTPLKDCQSTGCQSGNTCSYIKGLNQYKCISTTPTPTPPKDCRISGCQTGFKCSLIGGFYKCVATPTPTLAPSVGKECYNGVDGIGGFGQTCNKDCGGQGNVILDSKTGKTYCTQPREPITDDCITLGCPSNLTCLCPGWGVHTVGRCSCEAVTPTPTRMPTPAPLPNAGESCYNGIDGKGGLFNDCNAKCGGQGNVITDPSGNTHCKF